MRKTKTLFILLMCAMLLLGLCGCSVPSPPETAPTADSVPTTVPTTVAPTETPASDLYIQAAQPLREAQNLTLKLTTKKTISTNAETFRLVSSQNLTLTGVGTQAFRASMSEKLELGDYMDEFTEYYENGILYVNVFDTGYFQGNMAEADFLARFAPAVLLDESLYTNISAADTKAGTTVTFSDPAAPELWALPENATFQSANGTATINSQGTLTETTYTIQYLQGNTAVSMEVTAKADLCEAGSVKTPSDLSAYKTVENILVPRLYDTAVLFLYSAQSNSSNIVQTVVSQAAAYTLTTQTSLHYSGTDKNHISDIQYTATAIDGSSGTETYSQTEHFQNGVYTLSQNGSDPQKDPSVTAADMVTYLQDHHGDNLPALDFVLSATSEDLGGLLYLEMKLDETWGKYQEDYISYLLFQSEEHLDNHASAYRTTNSTYYMVIDSATGFPLSAGTTYSGIHTIDGSDYILGLELTQTYQLGDSETYELITGESLPEDAPETQATPLLYRVTGAQGQEMYLMGTIHVGDNRTAYLPSAVYEALDKSDALAVEADVIAFEEALEKDPALAAQIAKAYVSSDGKPVKEKLDAAIYDKAVKLLKASGNYNANTEYMIPHFWSSSIDNLYLTLGNLRSAKGADMRLLKLAKTQNKEIREVESGLFQIEMFSKFSPALQALLLEQSVGYTVAEYHTEVNSLYELWCEGDEAALREILKEDTTGMTDAEISLYREYLDAVIIQRNNGMLNVATSYLESGDTVFFAVGLAHLLQENGLVDTLQAAGYTVEQIVYG